MFVAQHSVNFWGKELGKVCQFVLAVRTSFIFITIVLTDYKFLFKPEHL